ncbi:MAG: BglII/BstYI family type II restriction endonuclease [bacterium]|nr:BglII/BstYI family type II restriction endonuclease [bacterium]
MKCDFSDIDRSIDEVIYSVGDDFCTKVSKEKTSIGKVLFDPKSMNNAFKQEFNKKGFRELKRTVEPNVPGWDTSEISAGTKQIDFALDRVLVEVQFEKYFAMFYDMAKLEYFYRQNEADVGVEIVPSFRLAKEMSSGVGRGEMLVTDIMGLQRQFPTFPVKIIFIEP